MKLAFLLFEYFPYGGLQRDMVAIATKALERGHQVTVFTRAWHGDPAPVEGLEVRTLPSAARSNHASDADFARRVTTQLDGFDRVVGFNKMPGLDWYYAADGCLADRYQGLKRLLPRYRSKLAMEAAVFGADAATGVLSISPPQKALYQHHYGTPEARFVSLPPGIRRDRVQPADHLHRRTVLRAELGISEVTPMLLFVGSGFRTKGLDRALQALAGLPGDARLFVVGEDKAAPYQRQARRLGLEGRVHFMGGRDDVPAWLWAADLLVHPAYAENTGTVLLEAAIAGLPVLTTRACGYADYIRDADLGRVLDDPTPESLAAAARELLALDRPAWWEKAARFAEQADIYSLTDHAVDAIEGEPPGAGQ